MDSLIETREYVLACYRYVERNPVRARVVPHPASYPWSSFRANGGIAEDKNLTEHPEYIALAFDLATRRDAYRRFCEGDDRPEFLSAIRQATPGGLPLVGARLKEQLASKGLRVERGKPGPRAQDESTRDAMTSERDLWSSE